MFETLSMVLFLGVVGYACVRIVRTAHRANQWAAMSHKPEPTKKHA